MRSSPIPPLLLGLLLVAACDRPAPLPVLAVSSPGLAFVAPPTGEVEPQLLHIENRGDAPLALPEVSVLYDGDPRGWLETTLSGSGDDRVLSVTANVAPLAPGTHGATIQIRSEGAAGSPIEVPVTLQVPPPSYAVDRTAIAFVAPGGGYGPPSQVLAVTNGGRGLLSTPVPTITYEGQVGWLDARVSSAEAGWTIEVSALVAGVPSGEHRATLTLAAEGETSPATAIEVSLSVPPPEIAFEHGPWWDGRPLQLYYGQSGEDPPPSSVEFVNRGGGQLIGVSAAVEYADPTEPEWLSVTVERLWRDQVRVEARSLGLTPGIHRATVYLTAVNAGTDALQVAFFVPETAILADPVSFILGTECDLLPGWDVRPLRKFGQAPLAKPTATVLGDAAAWLEARVGGSQDPWKLGIRLKARPPEGVQDAEVRVESEGVQSGKALVHVITTPGGVAYDATVDETDFWVQLGLGDPGSRVVVFKGNAPCFPTPPVEITYPDGVAPWLSVETRAGYRTQELILQPTAGALEPGQTVTARVSYPLWYRTASQEFRMTAGVLGAGLPMSTARAGHTLTVVSGSSFLAAGGYDGGAVSVQRGWMGTTTSWNLPNPLRLARGLHGAAAYELGVLLVGGRAPDGSPERTYSVHSSFHEEVLGDLQVARTTPDVILVSKDAWTSRFLVVSADGLPEIIDVWRRTSSLSALGLRPGSRLASAVKMPDGRVLAVGVNPREAAVYDPQFDEWSYTGSPALDDVSRLHVLPNGDVLALGSQRLPLGRSVPWAERWSALTSTWAIAAPAAALHGRGDTVSLTNGKVLAFGGSTPDGAAADVEVYDPATNTWEIAGALDSPREGIQVARLPSGRLVGAGGSDGVRDSAEVFTW